LEAARCERLDRLGGLVAHRLRARVRN
jgi:hypothetical protein